MMYPALAFQGPHGVSRAWRNLGRLAACALALALQPSRAGPATELDEARALGRRDPQQAIARLDMLRQQALRAGSLTLRLQVDAAQCWLQQDFDVTASAALAHAGMAAAANAPLSAEARLALMRLRTCDADAKASNSSPSEGEALLSEILAELAAEPVLAPIEPLALLSRGDGRSRQGLFAAGQADLLRACALFRAQGPQDEVERCELALAAHFRRVGDPVEALNLVLPLLERASQRGDLADVGVYEHHVARIEAERGNDGAAREHFEAALSLAQRLGDPLGQSYERTGLAHVLRRLGDLPTALQHARQAVEVIDWGVDDVQRAKAHLALAAVLNDLQQSAAALQVLSAISERQVVLDDRMLRAELHGQQARAYARLERWRAAFEAQQAKARLDAELQKARTSAEVARLRVEYARERDLEAMARLRREREQDAQLLLRQSLLIGLGALALALTAAFALRKVRQGRSLMRLADVDALTGLPNRRAIEQGLSAQLQHQGASQSLALLMMDIDHFKAVNDTHGHPVGDAVLRHVAQVLAAAMRQQDWVGRLGGEEFLAILPEADLASAMAVAERIRQAVEQAPFALPAGALKLTISIGVACAEPGETAAGALIERADRQLYEAKGAGRNCVRCEAPDAPQLIAP